MNALQRERGGSERRTWDPTGRSETIGLRPFARPWTGMVGDRLELLLIGTAVRFAFKGDSVAGPYFTRPDIAPAKGWEAGEARGRWSRECSR